MAATAFQTVSHALQVGVAVSIDLRNYSRSADGFRVINSNRAYASSGEKLLPPGLTLSGSVISGTPTTAGVTVCKLRAYRGTRNPDASWNLRKTGAHTSQRFDDSSFLSDSAVTYCTRDTGIYRSGTGCMRQYIPANASVNTYSHFFHSLKTPQSYNGSGGFASDAGFARGEEFYLQYAFRPGYNFVKWPWADSSPKIIIIDRLPPGTPTANDWEIVNQYNNGRYFYGYHGTEANPGNSGPGWLINDPTDSNDYVQQSAIQNTSRSLNGDNPGLPSGAGPNWTTAQQKRARNGFLYSYASNGDLDGRTDPLAAGIEGAVDQWHTVLVGVKVGTAKNSNDGRLRVWIAHEGQDYTLCVDRTYSTPMAASSPYFVEQGGTGLDTVFSGVFFNNLAYQEDMSAKPLTEHWIDEIICSPNFIPAPDLDGTSNYRTTDVLATFKVT